MYDVVAALTCKNETLIIYGVKSSIRIEICSARIVLSTGRELEGTSDVEYVPVKYLQDLKVVEVGNLVVLHLSTLKCCSFIATSLRGEAPAPRVYNSS